MEKNKPTKDEYTLEHQEFNTNLDPILQRAIMDSESGRPVYTSTRKPSADGNVVVDVVAKLKDANLEVEGLTVVRAIDNIVTGTVNVDDIDKVRRNENVVSLKSARRVTPTLNVSVPEVMGSSIILKQGLPGFAPDMSGAGVIIGVIDDGCDFVHNNFRKPDGSTRILFLWDQGDGTHNASSPPGFNYGRELNSTSINEALAAPDPYQHIGYKPQDAAHGTHVLDIAAGNGRATGNRGMAPQADIIFVQLAANDFPEAKDFGNSRQLLEAVDYIFQKATSLGKSAVINISLGTNGGPHDGSNPVEEAIDKLLAISGRAVVIAASNSWADRIHAGGQIAVGGTRTLKWEIAASDITGNEVEIWYGGNSQLDISLVDPAGSVIGPFSLGATNAIKSQGKLVGSVAHRQKDPNNGDNQVDILLEDGARPGTWSIVLSAVGVNPVDFHAWIERDDPGQSHFAVEDSDNTHTIGSISCGRKPIVVGSYDATVANKTISPFSSEGPTRDGRRKPEVSAPGQRVVAARALTQSNFPKSGTSMAAPHVAGLIALLMQASPNPLSIADIRQAVTLAARRDPPLGTEWQPRYGAGRINALATIKSQFTGAPTPAPVLNVTPLPPP
jgi:subtilisin family serine protease